MTPGFFKLYKGRKYNYRPIYYDPKKEEREEREKRFAKKEEEGEFKSSIQRGSFREYRNNERNRIYRDNARQSNIRLIVILGVLILVTYVLFKWI